MPNFPYPTYIEIVRALAKSFGVKSSNKALDDKAFDKSVDFFMVDEFVSDIVHPISKSVDHGLAKRFKGYISCFIEDYTSLIANEYADGITRIKMMNILSGSIFAEHIQKLYTKELALISGPSCILFFSFENKCVPEVLNWLEDNEPDWKNYLDSLNKENKSKVKSWQASEHLPSVQSIGFLQSWSDGVSTTQISWKRVKILLWLAAVMDKVNRDYDASVLNESCRLISWGAPNSLNIKKAISEGQNDFKEVLESALPFIAEVQHGLKRTVTKDEYAQEYFKKKILEIRTVLNDCEKSGQVNYWIDWHEARWFVLGGDLEQALILYKLSFENSLFRAGINQKNIIEESLVVASCVKSPDKVFLKQLKIALITFKYDIPSVDKAKSSSKFSDFVEDWEVENWKAGFKNVFPTSGMFPHAKKVTPNAKVGPLGFVNVNDVKHDYRNPNRKLKIGHPWKKTWPQLVWFVDREDDEVVNKLLESGASVDVKTSSDDTPLMIALECLDILAIPYRSMSTAMFTLISNQVHKEETVNQKSQKKRLLPIISAVKSGRLDVVKKVINMGADVNRKGLETHETALKVCLTLIAMVRNPDKYWKEQLNISVTPELLDSLRRNMPGLTEFSLDHQKRVFEQQNADPQFQKITKMGIKLQRERIEELLKLRESRAIALFLIESGADVNIEHTSPVKGYTSLMLAAELDEVEVFNKMLVSNGNPKKTYYCPNTRKNVDCWGLARFWGAKDVLELLRNIEYAFPKSQDEFHSKQV